MNVDSSDVRVGWKVLRRRVTAGKGRARPWAGAGGQRGGRLAERLDRATESAEPPHFPLGGGGAVDRCSTPAQTNRPFYFKKVPFCSPLFPYRLAAVLGRAGGAAKTTK